MLGERLRLHGLERPGPDVQRDERGCYVTTRERVEQRAVEMQTGGRRGDGARFGGVDRLIAIGIGGIGLVHDIGRQRHFAVPLQPFMQQRERAERDGRAGTAIRQVLQVPVAR